MRIRIARLSIIVLILVLGNGLAACGDGPDSGQTDRVTFDALVASPQRYATQYVCTEGVYAGGFEVSGLAASADEEDGYLQLTGQVIWLEGADIRTREACTRTGTVPPFEFCQAVVCGVFETGGGYGHGGAYAYQLTASRP